MPTPQGGFTRSEAMRLRGETLWHIHYFSRRAKNTRLHPKLRYEAVVMAEQARETLSDLDKYIAEFCRRV